jgi:hypothetical protein
LAPNIQITQKLQELIDSLNRFGNLQEHGTGWQMRLAMRSMQSQQERFEFFLAAFSVKALLQSSFSNREVKHKLRHMISNYGDIYFRCMAMNALAEHFRDDPQTLPLLQDRAVNDTDCWVRNTADYLIRRYFGE